MASTELELKWLMGDDGEADTAAPRNLLAEYYREIAAGPMMAYRQISQWGNKQGQSYYVHALDGIAVIHKLREAGVVEMTDLEEQLLFAAFTIHDINKIWHWRNPGQDQRLSYARIASPKNVADELRRLGFEVFFPDWEEFLEDITQLAHYHQHDAAPLADLDLHYGNYKTDHDRLEELGKLMMGVDNLDLSHILAEVKHKQEFLGRVNVVAGRRWKWVTHRLGENRGLLSNIIHNQVVAYLKERYGATNVIDLLYYPEGVAYLLHQRVELTWTTEDTAELARRVAAAVAQKQSVAIDQFIKARPPGIKVDRAALEGGASFSEVMDVIWTIVERKRYKDEWYTGYIERLRTDLDAAAADPTTAELAKARLESSQPILPQEQLLFRRGELATAYRNLLEDHLKEYLKPLKREPWTHTYALLGLAEANFPLYNQIDGYRRGYFLAGDCSDSLETLFERMIKDLATLTGEQIQTADDDNGTTFRDYLATNLEIIGANNFRDFKAQLQRYVKDEHRQCSNCSSPLRTVEWMAANAPNSVGVQSFSNRLIGGSPREPKRNVCGVCRAQFILEKLAWSGHRDKHGGEYTSFYLHFYPYSFFTKPHLEAMYSTLKGLHREDNTNFFLRADQRITEWGEALERNLGTSLKTQAKHEEGKFTAYSTKVNGVGVPNFPEGIGNTPTLPLNAPGQNYGQQFLFALTHALMLADFFGCRLVMSRTPVPLFSGEYLDEHELAFFVDGVPRNLRWLLPTDEYSNLMAFHDSKQTEGGTEYLEHLQNWGNEGPDTRGRAAFENIVRRLELLYRLSHEIKPNREGHEEILLELAVAAADDPLTLYFNVDRAIEKKVKEAGGPKGASKEGLAIHLSKRVVPLLDKLTKE